MLAVFIVFFFVIYSICECFKFKRWKRDENGKRIYNKPVVFVKIVAVSIMVILIIIYRFTKEGIVDRSNGVKNEILYFSVLFLLVVISIIDVKRVIKC